MAGLPVPHYLLEFALVHVHWISDATQSSHPLLPSSSAFSLSQRQGLFQWDGCLHQVAKVLELQLQYQSSQWVFRIDFVQDWWFDLLAVPVTFKSLLQHQSLKESILLHSAFFTVQLSHLYMSSGKTTALTMQTFVGKVMSLLLNTLSRFVIAFLPRSNCLLISWLQSPSAVILESKKRKSVTRFYIFPFYLTWSDGAGCHDLNFLILSFKSAFSPSSFNHNKRLFSSSSHSAIRLESFVYLSSDKTQSTGESEC